MADDTEKATDESQKWKWKFKFLAKCKSIIDFQMEIFTTEYWMNEWMNEWFRYYTPPNIRLINPISKRFKPNCRFTADEVPTWVEHSQDLMLRSTVSFLIVTYLGTFLSFNHLLNCIFPCPLLFLVIYALHAGYLFSFMFHKDLLHDLLH